MHLAQGTDKWQAVIKTVMSFWVSQNVGNFWTSYGAVSFCKDSASLGLLLRLGILVACA